MRAKRIQASARPQFSSQLNGFHRRAPSSFSCGLLFTIVLVIATFAAGVWWATVSKRQTADALEAAAKTSDKFLSAAIRQDYKADQLYLTASGQYTLSPDALEKTFNLLTRQYGACLGYQLQARQTQNVAGLQMCDCDYAMSFEKGTVTVHLILVQSYGGWKINTMSTD